MQPGGGGGGSHATGGQAWQLPDAHCCVDWQSASAAHCGQKYARFKSGLQCAPSQSTPFGQSQSVVHACWSHTSCPQPH